MFLHSSFSSKLVLLFALGVVPGIARAQPPSPPEPAPAAPGTAAAAAPTAAPSFEDRINRELGVPGGLTADEVAARAAATSWTLEARRAERRAASADADRALTAYIPRVTLTARYTRLSEVDAFEIAPGVVLPQYLDRYLLQAGVIVPVSDYFLRVAPRRRGSVLFERAAEHSVAAAQLQTVADAKILYYAWVRERLNVVVAEQAVEQARAQRGDIEQALAAGTASQADLLGVDARLAENERALDGFRHRAAELEEELRIARHDPEGTRYVVGESVPIEAHPADAREDPRALSAYALAHRPELAAAGLRADAASTNTDVERAGYLPQLELFGNYLYENPSSREFIARDEFKGSWNAGAQLTWVVSDLPGAAAATRSAEATAAAARAEQKELEDRVRRELSAALRALNDARAAVRTSARGLAAAEEAYRVRRLLFQNGRATTVELLDAELALTEARLISVGTRLELRIARVRLDYALGRRSSGPAAG